MGLGIGPARGIRSRDDGGGAAVRGGTGDTGNASAVEADITTSAAGGKRGEGAAGATGSWRGCGSDRHARRRGRRRILAQPVSDREGKRGRRAAQGERRPDFVAGHSCRLYPPTCVFAGWRRHDAPNAQRFPRNQDAADELRRARGSGLGSAPIARASWGYAIAGPIQRAR
jgi:hypothetical protein